MKLKSLAFCEAGRSTKILREPQDDVLTNLRDCLNFSFRPKLAFWEPSCVNNQLGQQLGQEIFRGNHASFEHTLPSGTYLLKILDQNSGEMAIKKLMIR